MFIVHVLQRDENKTKIMSLEARKNNSTETLEVMDEGLNEFDSKDDEDLSFLTRKIKRNLSKLGYSKSKRFKGKDKDKVVCYECKRLGHYKL